MKFFMNSVVLAAFVLSLLMLSPSAMAQHCPFDGTVVVIAQLVDENGATVKDITEGLVLQEVGNDSPELCTHAPKLVEQPMPAAKKAFYDMRNMSSMELAMESYCKDCTFLEAGFFGAKLGQATTNCMIKTNNDFQYVKRRYEIWFTRDGVTEKIPVLEENMYSLCTGNGPWSRIVPIKITVKAKKA